MSEKVKIHSARFKIAAHGKNLRRGVPAPEAGTLATALRAGRHRLRRVTRRQGQRDDVQIHAIEALVQVAVGLLQQRIAARAALLGRQVVEKMNDGKLLHSHSPPSFRLCFDCTITEACPTSIFLQTLSHRHSSPPVTPTAVTIFCRRKYSFRSSVGLKYPNKYAASIKLRLG